MNKILSLHIDSMHQINCYVPHWDQKINYYSGELSEKLDRFDEVTILYEDESNKIVIYRDILDDALCRLYNTLLKMLEGFKIIPDKAEIGSIGKEYNFEIMSDKKKFSVACYGVCSYKNVKMFFYSKNNAHYIEISPLYPWAFLEEEPENPLFQTFEQFMQNYRPYAFFSIDSNLLKEWLKQVFILATQVDAAL